MAAPLWLFSGPELGLRKDALEDLHQRALKKFSRLDRYTFYSHDVRIGDIVSLLQNGSLFASARFIVLYNAETIKGKDDIQMLADWALSAEKQGESCEAWLFLLSDEISIDKKLEALVPKENRIIFWELFENQKNQWLKNWFKKEGFLIDEDAVGAILDLVENNTEALKTECSRFSLCFEKNHRITAEDVDSVLTHNRQESAFTLFAALCEQGIEDSQRLFAALSVLQQLQQSKESSAVQLIAGLTYCFRRLRAWHSLYRAGIPEDFQLKAAGFISKKMQSQYAQAAKLWTAVDTLSCLALLASTDMRIRSGGTALEYNELQILLYAVVFKKGQPIDSYKAGTP